MLVSYPDPTRDKLAAGHYVTLNHIAIAVSTYVKPGLKLFKIEEKTNGMKYP